VCVKLITDRTPDHPFNPFLLFLIKCLDHPEMSGRERPTRDVREIWCGARLFRARRVRNCGTHCRVGSIDTLRSCECGNVRVGSGVTGGLLKRNGKPRNYGDLPSQMRSMGHTVTYPGLPLFASPPSHTLKRCNAIGTRVAEFNFNPTRWRARDANFKVDTCITGALTTRLFTRTK